jgi:hypothetical protein
MHSYTCRRIFACSQQQGKIACLEILEGGNMLGKWIETK